MQQYIFAIKLQMPQPLAAIRIDTTALMDAANRLIIANDLNFKFLLNTAKCMA